MKNQTLTRDFNKPVRNILLATILVTTIYFKVDVIEPFNSPKMWILILAASWILGWVAIQFNTITGNPILAKFALLLTLFLLSMTVAGLNSADFNKALFGEFQRRNGLLTYFSLVVVALTAAMVIRISNFNSTLVLILITSATVGVYGMCQHFGIDFVDWVNNYNAIIGTLGNPNFAAALMAVLAILVFKPVLDLKARKSYRFFCLTIISLLLLTIFLSKARQGLISFGVGFFLLLSILIIKHKKAIGVIFSGSGILFGIFAVLGMLQIGPLTYWFYKPSVSVRGYYWRAGLEMLQSSPFFGIGIDNYGNYFKQFREVNYSLSYGMEITSSNAHNTPIQFFATGGYPLGLTYLALLIFIFYVSVKGIKASIGNDLLIRSSVFSAWVAFQAQSLISIDNIGLAIWGFFLSGVLIGINLPIQNDSSVRNLQIQRQINSGARSILQPIISLVILIPALTLVIYINKSENLLLMVRSAINPSIQENNLAVKEITEVLIDRKFIDEISKVELANHVGRSGYADLAIKILNSVNQKDPRNFDALNYLAFIYEDSKQFGPAIDNRIEIAKLDPWNTDNLLQLGRDYKAIGDFSKMNEVLKLIESFASNTTQFEIASSELVE